MRQSAWCIREMWQARQRQTHLWDTLCSRTWLQLVGNAEGWGNTICTSRGFDFCVRIVHSVKLYVICYWMTLLLQGITTMDNEDGLLQAAWAVMSTSCSSQPCNSTPVLLPWKTSRMDRTHSHGLNDFNRYLGGMVVDCGNYISAGR